MMTSAEEKTCLHGIISDQVEVLISARHGEGLFAKTKLQQNTFIHVTHVHRDILNDTGLPAPANEWINLIPNNKYNHSEKYPNCKIVTEGQTKGMVTTQDVEEGQELLVNYNNDSSLEQPEESWIE